MELKEIAEYLITNWSYVGIFLVVFLEYANFPLPSEVVLPLIGILSSQYSINLLFVILVSTVAGMVGSLLNYYIGFKFGENILEIISNKFYFLKKPIEYTRKYTYKYGKNAVLTARLIPIGRTAISLVAGVYKMPLNLFIFFSSIGICIWNSILILLGYILRNNIDKINIILSKYSIVCILIIIIFIFFVIYKNKSNQQKSRL